MKKSASALDEERYMASEIAKAVAWTAFIRIGPLDKIREEFEGPDRYPDALAAAERLEREHSRFGRKALVFAITPRGDTHSVTPELYALACAMRAQGDFEKVGLAGNGCQFSPL